MAKYHHRKLPDYSTLLSGRLPRDGFGFESTQLQIWYNNTEKNWVESAPEAPHKHADSDEVFIVLRGKLTVEVEGERFEIKEREFCCFPKGVYHAILKVQVPAETLMIRAPSVDDKIDFAD